LEDRSRRPEHSPHRVQAPIEDDAVEARIVQLRVARPDWGARKLALLLDKEGYSVPAITVHRVLLRHDLVRPADRRTPATQRFERERVRSVSGSYGRWISRGRRKIKSREHFHSRCNPGIALLVSFPAAKETHTEAAPILLTVKMFDWPAYVLDDRSRYAVALEQTGSTRGEAVRERLESVFERSGVPEAMLMDHGVPWWNTAAPSGWTRFLVWLIKQGIRRHFSAIRHPQTQGKVERFHQSLERARTRRSRQQEWLTQNWLDNFRRGIQLDSPARGVGHADPSQPMAAQPEKISAKSIWLGIWILRGSEAARA
jgi:transposase InsO family protein